MEFISQADQCQMSAALRFKISVVETLQEYESDQKGQNEVEDGRGVMLETVIERPVSYQGVK